MGFSNPSEKYCMYIYIYIWSNWKIFSNIFSGKKIKNCLKLPLKPRFPLDFLDPASFSGDFWDPQGIPTLFEGDEKSFYGRGAIIPWSHPQEMWKVKMFFVRRRDDGKVK